MIHTTAVASYIRIIIARDIYIYIYIYTCVYIPCRTYSMRYVMCTYEQARCTLLQDEKKRLFDQEVVNRYRESDPNYTPPSPGKSPAKPAQPSSGDIKVENEVADVLAPNTSKEFLNPEPDLYLYDLLSHRNNKSSEEYAIDVIKRTDFFTFVFGIYVWASKLDAQSIIKDPPSTYYSPFLGPVAAALKLVELHFDPYAARDGSITREKYITIMKQNPTLGDLWNCYVLPEGCGQWGHWAFNWREQFMNTMQYTMSLMVLITLITLATNEDASITLITLIFLACIHINNPNNSTCLG